MSSKRGLVISPPVEIKDNSLFIRSSGIDPQELRFYLLFWDKLEFPQNNLFHFASTPDVSFLEHEGILTRTVIDTYSHSGDFASLFHEMHVKSFKDLDRAEPGVWSLARGENSISFSSEDLEENRGILFKLYSAIPVPDKDVPLQDVLDFRERRKPEQLALRIYLEELYQKVQQDPDVDLSLNTQISNLELALQDHTKASKEANFALRLTDLKIKIDYQEVIKNTAIHYMTGIHLPLAITAGIVGSISIEKGFGFKNRTSAGGPFEYVSSYNADLF